jgi:hypothetical protein
MKLSDVTEDIAVVSGALATYAWLSSSHPVVSGVLGAIAIASSALTAVLLQQGN